MIADDTEDALIASLESLSLRPDAGDHGGVEHSGDRLCEESQTQSPVTVETGIQCRPVTHDKYTTITDCSIVRSFTFLKDLLHLSVLLSASGCGRLWARYIDAWSHSGLSITSITYFMLPGCRLNFFRAFYSIIFHLLVFYYQLYSPRFQ